MIRVIISEKGVPDKELYFDKDEITIGRLQTNSIVLPKSNVSKRHAQIMLHDGQLTVVDLKSTNGTWVNGRKISAPKTIGGQDKIYIGDFTLRAEISDVAEEAIDVSDSQVQRIETQSFEPFYVVEESSVQDDRSIKEEMATVSGDMDRGTKETTEFVPAVEKTEAVPAESPPIIIVEEEEALLPDEMRMPDLPKEKATVSARIKIKREETPDELKIYQATLYKVYKVAEQRVFKNLAPTVDEFTDEEWKRYSDGTMQVIEQLRRLGEIPITIDAYTLAQDILFEFTGLGPLEELIVDDTVKNIFVNSSDKIFVTRGFHKMPVKKCFSSEEALLKTIWRLLRTSGYSGEKLPMTYRGRRGNLYFICMMPPLCSPEPVLILEKARESKLTLDDFIHGGVLNMEMASYLQERIKERKNILVYGNRSSGRTTFLNAIFNYVDKNERVVMIERRLELLPAGEDVVHISKGLNYENLSEVFSVIKNSIPDRIVIEDLDSNDIEVFLKLLLDGFDGIIATTFASSAEELIKRFSIMLEISNFKLSQEVARKALLHGIDLLIGITRFPCGRHRVTEIYEVASESEETRERGIRKIFAFVPEGTDKEGKVMGRFVRTGMI